MSLILGDHLLPDRTLNILLHILLLWEEKKETR